MNLLKLRQNGTFSDAIMWLLGRVYVRRKDWQLGLYIYINRVGEIRKIDTINEKDDVDYVMTQWDCTGTDWEVYVQGLSFRDALLRLGPGCDVIKVVEDNGEPAISLRIEASMLESSQEITLDGASLSREVWYAVASGYDPIKK
jgi:hypothetical protein